MMNQQITKLPRWYADNVYTGFGNSPASPDAALGWNTAQTVDGLFLGLLDAENTLIIAEYGDRDFDFAHGAQTNPTLFGHSAVQGTTQWWGITHNQTNALLSAGAGAFIIDAPSGVQLHDSSVSALTATSDGTTATWTAAGSDNIAITPTTAGNTTIDSGNLGNIGILTTAGTNTSFRVGADASDTTGAFSSIGITRTETTGSLNILNVISVANPAAASSAEYSGGVYLSRTAVGLAQNLTGALVGTSVQAQNQLNAANTLDLAVGGLFAITNTTGLLTEARAGDFTALISANTVTTYSGVYVRNPTGAGTLTNNRGIFIQSQTMGATVNRAIMMDGDGTGNAIEFGASTETIYATGNQMIIDGASGVALQDSSVTALSANSDGTDATWTAAASDNITIVPTTAGHLYLNSAGADFSVVLQSRTITAGANNEAVSIMPTWVAEDFQHVGLWIAATQNGANSSVLIGQQVQLIKATAASVLAEMRTIEIGTPTLMAGTVTNTTGLTVQDQSLAGSTLSYGIMVASQTANATTTRAIELGGTGVNNAIRLGSSPNLYSSGAEVINFSDSTDARNISFTLTAAGAQTIGTSAGNLTLTPVAGSDVIIGDGAIATTIQDVGTLGVGAITFAVDSNNVLVAGDGGGNTIATITGGVAGQELTILFSDGLITITDTDAHTANTVDLNAAFTSADDTVLVLFYDGTSWYEKSRSVN